MTIRLSLLAILDQGSCYGYQVRSEFDRRTGSTWEVNAGQIYNTLDRLVRDGLARDDGVGENGLKLFAITEAGHREVLAWFASPVEKSAGDRDELAMKVALSVTLPGVDVAAILETQRAATRARLLKIQENLPETAPNERFSANLIQKSLVFGGEAELEWLDYVEDSVASDGERARLPLSSTPPKRGRPARV